MARETDFVLRHLGELEELAEEVLTVKQQIVDLDKKRNQNREALRALQTKRTASQKECKEWVCFGNTFLKLPQHKTEDMLKEGKYIRDNRELPVDQFPSDTANQKQLDAEIEKLRDELKPKVSRLREMEGLPNVKGFDLKSLTKEEALAVHR